MQFLESNALTPAQESHYLQVHLPLVKRVVHQLASQADSVMDRQDLHQIALMGLLEALRRYGIPDEQFPAYAYQRVRGSVLDELRQHDWRPRRLRQKTHKTNDAIRELTRKLGREPTFAEISTHLEIDAEEYQEYLLLDSARAMESLDTLLSCDSSVLGTMEGRNLEDEVVVRDTLTHALASLDEREQMILTLYYQHELNMKEIALVMDLTEARVCQLNKKIAQKIKSFS
ncbi:MAG: FliA/WhiG family RNA polymerase sigma factor [Enterobacteriaceae bacterium]